MKRRTINKLLPGLLAVSLLVPYPAGAASLDQEQKAAVINRIKKCRKYTYDPENDRFSAAESDAADRVFMDLDELCGTIVPETAEKAGTIEDSRPAAMERLVHELISDRLMMLSRYITLDSSSRTIMIDQSSLSADGYRIVTH